MGVIEGLRRLAGQQVLERAMDHQVRVAPDRRGEVRIGREGQTKMADIVVGIDRLHHGTQQHDLDDMEVGPAP